MAVLHDFSHRSHGKPRDVRIGSLLGYLEARLLDKRSNQAGEIVLRKPAKWFSARSSYMSPVDQTSAGAPARQISWDWTVAL